MSTSLPISFEDIADAAQKLKGVTHVTPVFTSETANAMAKASVFFKCENLQGMGAFKLRGAYNAIVRLSREQREKGVMTYSSGNHAQAVALASRKLGSKAIILMPSDAPKAKIAATKGYGAEIVFYDRYKDDRTAIADGLCQEKGMTFIHPYDDPHVMAGQGTAVKEMIEQAGPLDVLFVPISGGGLISGSAVAAKHLCPNCTVIGVEPETGNDGQLSLRSGKMVTIDTPQTIADGAQSRHLGPLTFAVIQALVSDILTTTDDELIQMMRFFAERMKLVVEPTGCLGAVRAMAGGAMTRGKRVGVIISGGNVDLTTFASLLSQ